MPRKSMSPRPLLAYAATLVALAWARTPCCALASLEEGEAMCGPNCLLLVCHQLGVKANLNELAELSGQDDNGTTLAGLCRAAEKKGLRAAAMKIGVAELSQVQRPAIAHLRGNHFVVVCGAQAGGLKIVDPPDESRSMPVDKFAALYSGFALLIAEDSKFLPTPETKGPDVRFDQATCDLGVVEEGVTLQRTIAFRNAGNEDLRILGAQSTCPCTTVLVLDPQVPPGGEGRLLVTLDTTGREGLQKHNLYVASNDPITPSFELEVSARVKPPRLLVSDRALDLGMVRRSETASRMVRVVDFGDGALVLGKPVCDSLLVTADVARSTDSRYTGYTVVVTLHPGAPLGPFKTNVTLRSNYRREPQVDIPIAALITGDIKLDPNVLFFGLVRKGKECAKAIEISCREKTPLKIERIDNPLGYLSAKVTRTATGFVLSATLDGTAPMGAIAEEIKIYTNNADQPEIRIPLFALVEE